MLKGKTLLIDADDTLWENNIYFQEAMARFLAIMEDLGFASADIRKALNELERENIKIRGYGSRKFIISMKETFLRHSRQHYHPCAALEVETFTSNGTHGTNGPVVSVSRIPGAEETICQVYCGEDRLHCLVQRIEEIGLSIAGQPVQLLPGVAETVPELSARHSLILFTKGDPAEQMVTVERSGLASYFHAVEVVREKNCEAYGRLVEKYDLAKDGTWMVGNSPRSDINPATAAGLRAVFIPHPCTWELEEEPILRTEQVTVLRTFRELRTLFAE